MDLPKEMTQQLDRIERLAQVLFQIGLISMILYFLLIVLIEQRYQVLLISFVFFVIDSMLLRAYSSYQRRKFMKLLWPQIEFN